MAAQAVTMNLFVHCQNLKFVTSRDMCRTKAYHLARPRGPGQLFELLKHAKTVTGEPGKLRCCSR